MDRNRSHRTEFNLHCSPYRSGAGCWSRQCEPRRPEGASSRSTSHSIIRSPAAVDTAAMEAAAAAAAVEDQAAIVVLAFGTRGDVQPLAVLADGLRRRGLGLEPNGTPRVVFMSHADHARFLRTLWGSDADGDADGEITFIPSPSLPHAAAALDADTSSPEAVEAALRPQAHLQACIDACHGRRPRILIANLFALEAVHLAEALDAPLVMAHPYPAPTPAPAAFARRFRWMDPLGYKALRQAEPGFLAWADVEHWLWPAMIDTWQPFRRMLGLPASEESTDGQPHHHLIGRPTPPLLYLYSETVLPRPNYFTSHAHVCGYLWPGQDEAERTQPYVPPAALTSFLADEQPPSLEPSIPRVAPVLVTFGTMVSLGALGSSLDTAAGVLAAAFGFDATAEGEGEGPTLRQQGVRVLLDASGEPAWADALRRAFVAGGGKGVLVLEEPVPHPFLLRKCSVVVHHGGSGTTAAALRAGVAQVLIPMMMDQFLWAERVAWLDLGPAPLSLAAIFPSGDGELLAAPAPSGPSDTLAQALTQALQPATRLRAAAFGRRLRAEPSGLDRCLDLIRAHVEEEWPRLRASAPVPPALPPLPEGCELLTLAAPGGGEQEEGEGEGEEEDCSLTVAALAGSEAEVAFCCQEIFAPRGDHARDGWGYLKHGVRVREGDVVVDVGANIGLFAIYVDQVVMEEPDQLTVVAVEPAPRTFAALEYNLRRHGVKHRAVQVAVGEASGRATLHFYPHMPGNSTLDAARASSPRADLNARLRGHLEAGKETVEVEVTTLPLLLQRCGLTRVDLLKVDAEGHEEAVLRGMDEAAWSCVRQLVAEVHDQDGARGRIDALLTDAGGFVNVVWERPEWAEGGEGMDNVMVYAQK